MVDDRDELIVLCDVGERVKCWPMPRRLDRLESRFTLSGEFRFDVSDNGSSFFLCFALLSIPVLGSTLDPTPIVPASLVSCNLSSSPLEEDGAVPDVDDDNDCEGEDDDAAAVVAVATDGEGGPSQRHNSSSISTLSW